ncbi:hypothetical protein BHM03_00046770 [Ensete ventricosum]|uniref:Ty3 transposon capsid-like protein domain-containing protein n=1 Tax=Ensete ventricosum TaxID=4639 RepID=A0A445ML07_ENSVE|nr:hypothetical protein BHM03_00046770 [Ensete ventricosum]
MTSLGLFKAKLEAFETRMDAKLCALFEEFRLGRSPSPRRSQLGANSDCKKNPSEIRSEDKTWEPYTSTTSISFVQLQEGHINQDAQSMKVTSQPKAYKPSAPINYKNFDEELTKIRQTSTIQEYQIRFERLTNQTRDWSKKQIFRTFIKRLKQEIQEEVKARQPYTLKAAISFARLHEDRLNQDARRTKVVARPAAQRLSAPSTTSRSPQPKKLREEFRDRLAKGLCWHCNKLWSRDHHCKKERPLLVEPTEEPKLKDIALESEEKDMKEKPQSAARTFYAPPQILDIDGFIKHQPVTILADTRSSNDLMNDKRKQVLMWERRERRKDDLDTVLGEAH